MGHAFDETMTSGMGAWDLVCGGIGTWMEGLRILPHRDLSLCDCELFASEYMQRRTDVDRARRPWGRGGRTSANGDALLEAC